VIARPTNQVSPSFLTFIFFWGWDLNSFFFLKFRPELARNEVRHIVEGFSRVFGELGIDEGRVNFAIVIFYFGT
jgi:hypothetical protein